MSTGLDASTVTPGMTAPEASLTMPAIAGCENAGADKKRRKRMTADTVARARIKGFQSVRHDTPREGDYAPSPLDGGDQVGRAGAQQGIGFASCVGRGSGSRVTPSLSRRLFSFARLRE